MSEPIRPSATPTVHPPSDKAPDASGAGRRSATARFARFSVRHRYAVLAAWLLLAVGLTIAGRSVGGDFANGSDVALSGSESQQVADALEWYAPERSGDSVTVVLHDERGWNTERSELTALYRRLEGIPRVESVSRPSLEDGSVSPDGSVALLEVSLAGEIASAPRSTYRSIVDTTEEFTSGSLEVEASGKGIRKLEAGGGAFAEVAGLLAALVVLVILFGSLLAASLPLITAVVAVGSTIGLVTLLTHVFAIPDYAISMLVLVGLGVGIDYALLVFSRYRSAVLNGAKRDDATALALSTAGRSVLFAGASVVIALLGMFTLGIAAFEGTVAAVALTVMVTVIASLTLLPALLSLLGGRLEKRILKRASGAGARPGERWRRWAGAVQRAPWAALVGSGVVMCALALPVLSMRLGFNDAGNDRADSTSRVAYDLVADKFGPGANGPLLVLVQGSAVDAEEARSVIVRARGIRAERVSAPIQLGEDVHLVRAEAMTGPQDPATADAVERLRTTLSDRAAVGGATAANIDYSEAIASRFPLFVATVIGVSGLLLLIVFRSVAVAVKAAVLNVLSIGAAMGAMTLVYQHGWFWGTPGPIESFIPVFIFAVVFGLSMDYEVFLLSRMREEWLASRDAGRALREGLGHTGGVITAAAAIMVVVFGSFALLPDRMLQQAGFAMATAVFLDAVVIRCLIVPAVMHLLGARAWWLPRPLARVVPHLDVDSPPPSMPGMPIERTVGEELT